MSTKQISNATYEQLIDFFADVNWSYISETLFGPGASLVDLSSWIILENDGTLLNLYPPPIWDKLGEERPEGGTLGFMYIGLSGADIRFENQPPFLSGKITSIKLAEGHYDQSFNSKFVDVAELSLSRAIDITEFVDAAAANYNAESDSFQSSDFLTALGIGLGETDQTAPLLVKSSPFHNEKSVKSDANIKLTFSEKIKAGVGEVFLVNQNDKRDNRSIPISDSKQVIFKDNELVINPARNLRPGATYRLLIPSGGITDLAENSFVGFNAKTNIRFSVNQKPSVRLFGASGNTSNKPVVKPFSGHGLIKTSLYRLLDELFVWEDQDGDSIKAYKISLSEASNPRKAGYFLEKDNVPLKGNYTLSRVTFEELSWMNYVAGEPGTTQKLSLSVFDGKEWSLPSKSVLLRTNRPPETSISNRSFSPTLSAQGVSISNWLGANTGDPDGDPITGFKITDWNAEPDSGFFRLGNKRIGTIDTITTFTVKPNELRRLQWVPGSPGTEDPISITAIDSVGDASEFQYAVWNTPYGKTDYSYASASGLNHVSEGNIFEVKISKNSNFRKATSLQYAILKTAGNITAGRDSGDFSNLPTNPWQKLNFAPVKGSRQEQVATIRLQTRADSDEEGSETARLWIYDETLDDKNPDWLKNPAYRYLDFQIHDKTTYITTPSAVLAEGEISRMRVARFGGGSKKSTVELRTETLPTLYKGLSRKTGLAELNTDFEQITKRHTFTRDYDAPGGGDELTASSRLIRDNIKEEGEMFSWRLYEQSGYRVVKTNSGSSRRLPVFYPLEGGEVFVSVMDRKPVYNLQSVEFFSSLFNGIVAWVKSVRDSIADLIRQPDPKVAQLNSELSKSLPVSLPVTGEANRLVAAVPLAEGGLIGVDAGSLIGVDAGSLIGVDAGSLIGVDAGSLIGVDAGSLIGVDAGSLTTMGLGGTYISSAAGAQLRDLSMANGVPLIAAGGLN